MAFTTAPLFDVLTATASELQNQLTTGQLTSVQITSQYLSQIKKHNHAGAKLNAMITIAPRDLILKQAEELDKERAEGKSRGPLHGLPIIIKDCFLMGQDFGMKTTVGAFCFANEKAKQNATVVSQLCESGLIILGTANLSELCHFKAENMTMGWSAYGEQTKSAYDPISFDFKPKQPGLESLCGGSSSGSAVGVSAGFAPLSLGTETGGSNVYPASRAGLYAMTPTRGAVSAGGVFRFTRHFDGVGAMAKTPLDLSHLIETILDPEGKVTLSPGRCREALKGDWEGLSVGIAELTWETGNKEKWESVSVKVKYDDVVRKIREHGGRAVYPVLLPGTENFEHNGLRIRNLWYHECQSVIQEFCSGFENPKIRSLADIVKFNNENAEKAMPEPHRDQKVLLDSLNDTLSDEESEAARLKFRRLGREILDAAMEENGLDLVVANSDCDLVIFSSYTGYPIATVPLGNLEDGSPFGLFLIAKEGREDILFRFMSAFEKIFEKVDGPDLAKYENSAEDI